MELLSNFAYALVIEPKRRLSVLSSAISEQEWRLLFVTNNLEKKLREAPDREPWWN